MAGASGSLLRFDEYYNNSTTNHFYTSNPGGENLSGYFLNVQNKWSLFASSSSAGIVGSVSPVYRLYRYVSPTQQSHFYTTSTTQRSNAQAGGYTYEGIVGYGYTSSGSNRYAVYRYYSSADDSHWYEQRPDIAARFPAYVYKQVAWYSPVLVYACTDSSASNYNPYANQNSGCQYFVYGCTDPLASNYNPNANVNQGCTYPTPVISMSLSQNSIIQGGSSTLSWTIFNSTSRSLSSVGSIAANGSLQVSPADDTTYTITANYYGYTSSTASKTLVVYVPPVATLTVDDTTIVQGENTILRWSTTGDASTASISPGIGSTNLTSFQSISPSQTTTYTLSVSGNGGSDSSQVTVTVLQPPSVTVNGPIAAVYGSTITVSYEGVNVATSFTITPYYYDLDGLTNTGDPIILPVGDNVSGNYTFDILPWENRGPSRIEFVAVGVGYGGLNASDIHPVIINIDRTPNLIDIPESRDTFKNEEPVISPDREVTTLQLLIDDIDIPVEIKADYPIQVEIDNDNNYRDVEQI